MKTQSRKSKFRSTSKWKKFRKGMKAKCKVDYITNRPLIKGWNLHHLDLNSDHYEDISNESHFCCLNKTSHELVHWLFRYKDWRDVLNRTKELLQHMEELNN